MKYTAKAKLKYVLVVDKDKSTPFNTIYKIYDAKDSYSGVYFSEGGLTDAEYVSKRNSLVVGSDGKIVSDKLNGVWLKETAKPLGSIEKTEAMDLNTASEWENYLKGGSGSQEVKLSPTRISKGFYGWKGKTSTEGEINGYDWEITTMKRSDGKLSSTAQGGKTKKGDGYSSFEVVIFQDPSKTLIVTTPKVVNEKRVREQHEEAVKMFKELVAKNDLPKKKYAKGGEMRNVQITKDDYFFRENEPNRVYHDVEGMYGNYWFVAKTDNSYKHGYGSNGINRGCVYKLKVWRGGNPVGRDKSTKGGHVSEDFLAGYYNKWDLRPRTKEAKEVVSAIVEWLENNICDLKRNWSSVKFAKGGEIADFKGAGMFAGGGGTEIIPPKGELRNADNHLLKYEKNGSEYEFYVYKPVSKIVSGYEQTKHICVNADCALKMSYKQFINYLYGEGYIDDRKNAKGGYMADGGRLENISPVIKPKIEAIENILPKALGEGGYMKIVFAFQTKDGYAFNMESKSDYPVNRATPKLKRIGVVVERTGEKGKRLITIPKGVFDQMTTIYMVGGEFADGGIQNHPLNIQIHTKIAEELGREMAARFIITDYSRDSGIGAVRLIEMAIQRGFISLDEINSDIIYSAEEKADESAEMEEIGSSDTNILIHTMLRNAGIEMDYEGNRMVRKYTTPEEANIKSSTHKNEK